MVQFAHRIARVTQAYRVIVAKIGKSKAEKNLNEEIRRSISENQSKWNENMAIAHEKHMRKEELHSLLNEGSNSPYYSKILALQGEIGITMRDLSEKLLDEVVKSALERSFVRADGKI